MFTLFGHVKARFVRAARSVVLREFLREAALDILGLFLFAAVLVCLLPFILLYSVITMFNFWKVSK